MRRRLFRRARVASPAHDHTDTGGQDGGGEATGGDGGSGEGRVSPGAVAVEVQALGHRFGQTVALDGLSLAVPPGELYGLVGPDGAGKSTTLRILAGVLRPDAGCARVAGLDTTRGGAAVRERIGYMPQQYSLYGDLSVDENMAFFGRLFGLRRGEMEARRARLLEITRLDRFRGRRADDLSGGMYKKLALACALLHQPRVLVLDEPSNGVDPVSRRELWDLLYDFVAHGMAVVLATPYMDEAARCHRVGLLSAGRLVAEGRPEDLVEGSRLRASVVRAADRDAAERALLGRPEVLALSPEGEDLRAVVAADRAQAFDAWASSQGMALEGAGLIFEDVYLGLVAGVTGGHPGPGPEGLPVGEG